MNHRYPISYEIKLENPGKSAEELRATKRGGSDAIAVISIALPPSGDNRIAFAVESLNGSSGQPMTDDQLFDAWIMLAHIIAECSSPGDDRRKKLCAAVVDLVREWSKGIRA